MTTMKKPVKKYNNGGPVTTTKQTTKKPVKPAKPVKKDKTVSQAIGDITLRDVKNAGESALQITTLGGYGKIKEALGGNKFKFKKIGEKKYGGKVAKAKAGGSFDLNKDGKTTFKDVLIGRGVLPKTAKKGASVKKAKSGASMKKCRYGCK
jgi:hypothetical protein